MSTGLPFPDISPEIVSVELFGLDLALRWYALAYVAGIVIGWAIASSAMRRPALWRDERPPTTPAGVEALMTWAILGIVLGGRIGYALFYQPGVFADDPLAVLRIWEGGMSFHGGFLGVVAAVLIWCRASGVPVAPMADIAAVAAPAGLFLGRIANFINAELWGRETDLPWGVIFPGPGAQTCAQALPGLCARHPSQLYEAALEGLVLGTVLLWLAFRRGWLKTPWALTGTFLAGYGLVRFAVEFVRQPDAQFASPGNPLGHALQFGGAGLTMGQILSLPMIALGLWLVGRARR